VIDLVAAREQLKILQAQADELRKTLDTEILTVPQGGTLQQAIDAAPPGAVIKVHPGVYAPIVLRKKPEGRPITIQPDTTNLGTGRLTPDAKADLIQIQSPSDAYPIQAARGAAHYVLRGFCPLPYGNREKAFAAVGDETWTDAADIPVSIVYDQWLVEADPERGGRRGIMPQCRFFTLSRSHLAGLSWKEDAWGLCGWSGLADATVSDNYIEASGENILIGGADSRAPELMPRRLRIVGNQLTKPLAWRSPELAPTMAVKNSLEVKCGLEVLIDGNLIEHSWVQGQVGYLLLLTVRNQNGRAPWTTIADVTVSNNVLRDAAAGILILGLDNEKDRVTAQIHESIRMARVTMTNNLVYGIDPRVWTHPTKQTAGAGRLLRIAGGPADVVIAHNTMIGTHLHSFLDLGDPADVYRTERLRVVDNVVAEGNYGIAGDNTGQGRLALAVYAPDAQLEGNVILRGGSGRKIDYGPQPNRVIDAPTWDPLTPLLGGPYVTTDGDPPGCDRSRFSAWLRETAGV
jgi:hypothetical protein